MLLQAPAWSPTKHRGHQCDSPQLGAQPGSGAMQIDLGKTLSVPVRLVSDQLERELKDCQRTRREVSSATGVMTRLQSTWRLPLSSKWC